MKTLPLIGSHLLPLCQRLVFVDPGQHVQDITAFFGEARCYFNKLPSSVRNAVADDRFELLGEIPEKLLTCKLDFYISVKKIMARSETPGGDLSRLMRDINGRNTQAFNW